MDGGIQLVVFDMAGTTVRDNNYVGSAFQSALNHFGFNFTPEEIKKVMGYEKSSAIRMLLESQGQPINIDLIAKIHTEFVRRMVNFYETSDQIEALPNVESTFAALRERGIKVALDTGFSRVIAEVIVRRLGWGQGQGQGQNDNGKIDFLVASDEVEHGRPASDMIEKIKAAAGIVSSAQVAKVGDTEVDILEGLNAGCKFVIGVTTGAYSREALLGSNPTHVVDDIAEIIPIITNA